MAFGHTATVRSVERRRGVPYLTVETPQGQVYRLSVPDGPVPAVGDTLDAARTFVATDGRGRQTHYDRVALGRMVEVTHTERETIEAAYRDRVRPTLPPEDR